MSFNLATILTETTLAAPELEYHLADSAAALLIGFEGLRAEASKACEITGVPLYLVSAGADPNTADSSLPEGTRPVTELISTAPLDEPGGDVVAVAPRTPPCSSTPAAPRASRRGPSSPISSCT